MLNDWAYWVAGMRPDELLLILGFLLVVEGGRIDHAGHGNDPAGHRHDILAYDAMVARVEELMAQRFPIHFHSWTPQEFLFVSLYGLLYKGARRR